MKILNKLLVNKDFGNIGNHEGTVFKDIEVKINKDSLVDAVVGLGLIGIGAAFLIHNSFYRGANAFMDSEYKVMDSLGLFVNNKE